MLLEAERLGVRYLTRRVPALREVTWAAAPGERVLLAGPSGAGKSTLALCMNGLIPNSIDCDLAGAFRVEGRSTTSYPPGALAEHVGMVFQDPSAQFTMLTVEDEVAFGLENLGVPTAEMRPRVAAALAAVGLADRADWRIDRLSGGQQQRVALAAALAMRPRALVLDEPSAQLDPRNAEQLYAEVERLAERQDVTLVLVEHNLDDVVPGLVDRVLLLAADGTVAADGPVAELFGRRPSAQRWAALGVWLPTPVALALALGAADALPLSEEEGAAWLAAHPGAQATLRLAAKRDERGPAGGEVVASARGVWQEYRTGAGTYPVLRDVDLEVRAGELVAVVGANGSGKTTLLRTLTGLLSASRGRVEIAGRDVLDLSDRQVASLASHVFQNPEAGFVADTVEDELAYGPRALGWDPARVAAHTADLLERFGLTSLAPANPFTLSQGQKRRLSVAAALVLGPRLLVLDEPTFGQDRQSAQALVEEIGRLRDRGLGILLATHDLGLVLEIADRVVALEQGRVIFDGPPAAILERPAVLAAAGQRRPPLSRLLARARNRGADVPLLVRWRDVAVGRQPVAAVAAGGSV